MNRKQKGGNESFAWGATPSPLPPVPAFRVDGEWNGGNSPGGTRHLDESESGLDLSGSDESCAGGHSLSPV